MTSDEPSIIEELRESYRKWGPLRKVIRTKFGIAGGNTRKKAVEDWPETFKEVKSYYEHLKLVGIDNLFELKPAEWWTELLTKAARELEKEGVEKGKIAKQLAEDFPRHERTIYRYLPTEFKDPHQVLAGRAKAAATVATEFGVRTRSSVDTVSTEIEQPKATTGLREPKSYPSPTASSFGTKTHTPSAVKLAATLSGMKVLTEFQVERDGMYRCQMGHISELEGGELEEAKLQAGTRCRRCSQPAGPMVYSIDVLVDGRIALEVEGEGSASADNDERDDYLTKKGYFVVHVPNEYVEKHLEVVVWGVNYIDKSLKAGGSGYA